MTIRDFLRVMWEGKYYLLASFVIALAAAVVYAEQKPDVYQASASVQINAVDLGESANPATTTTVDTDPRLVEAPAVLEAVGAALGTEANPQALADQISAQFDAATQVMLVTATAGTPEGAVELANAVASAYVDSLPGVIDGQIAAIDERRDALEEQLDAVLRKLRADGKDPLANAEKTTIIAQYESLSASRSTLQSIVTPAVVRNAATGWSTAVVVGLSGSTIIIIGALAGLALGVGIALARHALDSRVRARTDAADAADVPVIAELYGVRSSAKAYRKTPILPISSRVASPFTESIRELRTALHVAIHDRAHAVVVVTATDPHAQRSFIAANLAASWAMSGRSTVAVSGDLRRPVLEDLLPRPSGPETDADGMRPTQVPNLRFLALHDPTMDPADYLATDRVRTAVEAARDASEILVIDAPPVLAAADATILGAFADCVVLIATAGRTGRNVLAEAADRLRINGVPLTGVALAGVKGDRRMVYASTYGEPVPATQVASDEESRPAHAADVPTTTADTELAAEGSAGSPDLAVQPEAEPVEPPSQPVAPQRPPAFPPAFPPTGARAASYVASTSRARPGSSATPAEATPSIDSLLRTTRRP